MERGTFCLDQRNCRDAASPSEAARLGAAAAVGFRRRCRRPAARQLLPALRDRLGEFLPQKEPGRAAQGGVGGTPWPRAGPAPAPARAPEPEAGAPALSGAGLRLRSRRWKKDAPGERPRGGARGTARAWWGSITASPAALVKTEFRQEREVWAVGIGLLPREATYRLFGRRCDQPGPLRREIHLRQARAFGVHGQPLAGDSWLRTPALGRECQCKLIN